MKTLGGLEVEVEDIKKYRELDRQKHPNKYIDPDGFTKEDILILREEIREGRRKKFPHGTWKNSANISFAAQICIDEKRSKIKRPIIFKYPGEKEIINSGFTAPFNRSGSNIREFYRTAGCFNPESEYYDPLFETFPILVTEKNGNNVYRPQNKFKEKKNIEDVIFMFNSLAILSGITGKKTEELRQGDFSDYCLIGMLNEYDGSPTQLREYIGLESNPADKPDGYWQKDDYKNLWDEINRIENKLRTDAGNIKLQLLKSVNSTLWSIITHEHLQDEFYKRCGGRVEAKPGHWKTNENRYIEYQRLESCGVHLSPGTANRPYAAMRRQNIEWDDEMKAYNIWKNNPKKE